MPPPLLPCPSACAQIAVRTCQEEAGEVQEVHFFLFEQPAWDAWLAAAEAAELQREEPQAEEPQAEEQPKAEEPKAEEPQKEEL